MDQRSDSWNVDSSNSELDAALRATELELRSLHARRAQILAATAARGSHQTNGHRTLAAYIRATCNTSTASARRDHTLARLVATHPGIADALHTGHISVDHAHEIARIHTNKRINQILDTILDSLLTMAEHLSLGEFRIHIGTIIGLADQDGAYQEQQHNIKNRRAWVDDMAGSLHLTASGGDPLTAAQVVAVFESFVHAELQADLEARKAEHGDSADGHPLPRSQSQRNYDALVHVFSAAAGSPDASKLPDPTVNIVIDDATLQDTLTHAGLVLPNGNHIDLDEDGNLADPDKMLADLSAKLLDDPDALAKRICNLTTGAPIHPTVALRALLTGHVRRVVVDSRNVVTELGTRSRVFTGAAREAALLLTNFCTHNGCTVRSRHSQVDHGNRRRRAPRLLLEWANGGTTSQWNAQARCGPHNRFKHRERWQTKRDERGRTYDVRPDNTIVLPVGERPPDLTRDELDEQARSRLRSLCEL